MDAWYYKTSVACDTMENEFILLSSPLVWSTLLALPRRCGICMHQHSTKWHKKKKTLHILTHGTMRGCGFASLVVCINDKICDIRERNVTIKSEIWTTNICSLRFQDIREWVILWKLILWSLGCTPTSKLGKTWWRKEGTDEWTVTFILFHFSPAIPFVDPHDPWEMGLSHTGKLGMRLRHIQCQCSPLISKSLCRLALPSLHPFISNHTFVVWQLL